MDVLGIVLAGGRGERLYPLTAHRTKAAVPFGGKYRIIDFVLSNFVNSHVYSIYVLTQFKSQSLIEHMNEAWRFASPAGDHFVQHVPAQMRSGRDWYQGTADAVYQNLNLIYRAAPDCVAVFSADHIYRMNIRQMVEEHRARGANVTIAALPVRLEEASQFGIMQVDDDWWVRGFQEKPESPAPLPEEPEFALASMGNYIFNTQFLVEALTADAGNRASRHDFGRDILPALHDQGKNLYAYDFRRNRLPAPLKGEEPSYWRDVGTIEAYYAANMDLRAVDPSLNLYNHNWPIRTASYGEPPAKFVFDEEGRTGMALDSVVGEGTIISGSLVRNSVIGRSVRIHSYGLIEESVLMDWVEVGRGCRIRRAIVDKNVAFPPGTEIGYDLDADRQRYFVSETGIVVVPKAERVSPWFSPKA